MRRLPRPFSWKDVTHSVCLCVVLYCTVLCVAECMILVLCIRTHPPNFSRAQLKLLYVRKVNPNRVHLGTELTVDAQGEAQVSGYDRFYC